MKLYKPSGELFAVCDDGKNIVTAAGEKFAVIDGQNIVSDTGDLIGVITRSKHMEVDCVMSDSGKLLFIIRD